MHLNRRAGNIPLFMRCGAYRALLELKMLWPYAIGGYRTFVLKILPTPFLSALHIGRG